MKPLKNRNRLLLFALSALLLGLLNGCNEESAPPPGTVDLPRQKIITAKVTLEPVHNHIEILGTIESVYRAEISAKLSGTISQLPVVLGSEVKKGALLVEISAGEIDAKLRKSRAQLMQAKRNLERENTLLKKSASTPEIVKSLEESLSIAEAAYEEARTMQSYTRILAPFDARVTRKLANIGDLATLGKPLLYLEDESNLQVITDIPDASISQVKHGDIMTIEVPAAGLSLQGTVAEIAPTTDPSTRTSRVKLNIDTQPHLRPGQFTRVALPSDGTKTLTVPTQAVVPYGQMKRIYIISDNIARLRLVRTGEIFDQRIEILSGVKAGDTVAVSGNRNLLDGQPVYTE